MGRADCSGWGWQGCLDLAVGCSSFLAPGRGAEALFGVSQKTLMNFYFPPSFGAICVIVWHRRNPGTGHTTTACEPLPADFGDRGAGEPRPGCGSSCSSLAVWAPCGDRHCRTEVLKEPWLADPSLGACLGRGWHPVLGDRAVAVPLLSFLTAPGQPGRF